MTLTDLIAAVEARTAYRFALYGSPSDQVRNMLGARLGSGSGFPVDYSPSDVERAVTWLRMRDCYGSAAGGSTAARLRRKAQDVVSEGCRTGWVVISEGQVWFTSVPPREVIMSAAGASAMRIHDDCACTGGR